MSFLWVWAILVSYLWAWATLVSFLCEREHIREPRWECDCKTIVILAVCSYFSESYAAEANDAAGADVAKDCALPWSFLMIDGRLRIGKWSDVLVFVNTDVCVIETLLSTDVSHYLSYLRPWLLWSINDYMSERVNIIYCRKMKRIGKSRSWCE